MTKESFQDKELEILRAAVDKAEKRSGRELISSPEIQKWCSLSKIFTPKETDMLWWNSY